MENSPVLNRIGNTVLNWNHIESVVVAEDGIRVLINFQSGKFIEIYDKEQIEKIKDFFSVFPDVLDDETRTFMKQKSSKEQYGGVKTDVNIPDRFTDIATPLKKPSQDSLNWKKTQDWKRQLNNFKR